MMKLLALEASANSVSIAVQNARLRFSCEMPASSKTSAWLIPSLIQLLEDAQLQLSSLDAVLFGQGPGAFTGLRTVCSVVQGLAMGAHEKLPIVGVDTLHQLAQAALNAQESPDSSRFVSILDARMDEWYVGAYEYSNNQWSVVQSPVLCKPHQLALPKDWSRSSFSVSTNLEPAALNAGVSLELQGRISRLFPATPHATLCLDLFPWLTHSAVRSHDFCDPLRATPIYIRDQVALTTRERELAKLAEPK
jgi:tRNA threonylcarbamoyladenosine biosynthesis protein TsaB